MFFSLQVPNIISTLEAIFTKGDLQSSVVEYEALNVIIRYVHCNMKLVKQLLSVLGQHLKQNLCGAKYTEVLFELFSMLKTFPSVFCFTDRTLQ